MEMHHKLRRDPNWHPSACNICGQLGHQAVNCTNGTINWKQIYGEEAFRLKSPVYESDYVKLRKGKEVDLEDLGKRAQQYAKMRAESLGIDYSAMKEKAAAMLKDNEAAVAAAQSKDSAAAGTKRPAEGEPAATPALVKPKTEGAALPAGWSTATDAQGRTYYWHTKTKKVQWTVPDENSPTE
mmetsp:Transcript_7048/g.20623  ORF Transcript_7048/g.20623 Transcript_7048/m.20623 type:complete len:183 (+) Transcript_7048:333-881(+)